MGVSICQLSAEQGHRCAYCGVAMRLPGHERKPKWPHATAGVRRSYRFRLATRDHIVPRSAGGKDGWENLVAACLWCNGYRSNQPAEAAFRKIEKRLRRKSHPHQQFALTGWWPSSNNGLRTLHDTTPSPAQGSGR